MLQLTPRSTLFPYTTLFRSLREIGHGARWPTARDEQVSGMNLQLVSDIVFALGRREDDVGHELRSEENTSELQSHSDVVCRLLVEKKKKRSKESMALLDLQY